MTRDDAAAAGGDATQTLRRRSTTDCARCPLRGKRLFKAFTRDTLAFMKEFKKGEMNVTAGTPILAEGSSTPQLYTALSGMGLRTKSLPGGERQVISFVMPGDFIGLQAGIMGEMGHSVEATTPMTLCVFDRSALWDMYRHEPDRAFDLTWVAAVEEHFLGETLVSLGQRTGLERVSWALLRLYKHILALDLGSAGGVPLPYRQQDLADALGLSLVHTNKTLATLRQRDVAVWKDGTLRVRSVAALAKLAGSDPESEPIRPLM